MMRQITRHAWLKRLILALPTPLFLLVIAGPSSAATAVTYYEFDALGSPVAATDSGANVLSKETDEPFGARIQNNPAAADNSRWYTGKPLDAETGLGYLGARYYDPAIGRFMTIDPDGFTEENLPSSNWYQYGNNNLYRYTDPTGKEFAFAAAGFQLGGFCGPGAPACTVLGGLLGLGAGVLIQHEAQNRINITASRRERGLGHLHQTNPRQRRDLSGLILAQHTAERTQTSIMDPLIHR